MFGDILIVMTGREVLLAFHGQIDVKDAAPNVSSAEMERPWSRPSW